MLRRRHLVGLAALAVAGAPAATAAAADPTIASFSATRSIEVGERATVRGRIAPRGPAIVLIERRRANYTWEPIATLSTDARGEFRADLPLRRSARLRASIRTAHGRAPGPQRRNVAVVRRARLRVEVDPREAIAGRPISVSGRVWPARPGERAFIEARRGAVRRRVASLIVRPGGRVSGRVRLPSGGSWRLRLLAPGRKGVDRRGVSRAVPVALFGRNPHRIPASAAHYIVQDLGERHLYYYERGALRRVHDVVFGKPSTPTPVGRFRVYSKTLGPSVVFGPYALWYYGNYGIHGTNQPELLTRDWRYYSAGCTRNTNENILWLWPRVPVGTPVLNIR
jgi:hypothetical protein